MRRTLRSAVAAAVVAALALSACGSDDPQQAADDDGAGAPDPGAAEEPAAGGQLVFAAEQEPSGFNYNTAKDSLAATRDVIENLFYFAAKAGPDGSLHYEGLAGEPELVSEDPHVAEWSIHPDATWSDGTPVTTDDIEFYYENMVDPDNDVASRVGYSQIETFEVVDDKTFRVTFESPYGDFRGLWQAVPQAEHLRNHDGGWENGLNDDPGPSAGPYQFENWNRGESLTLVPNPEWRLDPTPTLDRIVFRFLPESATVPDALRNGEVDLIEAQAQIDLYQQLSGQPDLTTEVLMRPAFEHLVLNLQHPIVGDLAVRQALAHALDRNQIVEAMVLPFTDQAQRLDNMVFTDVQSPDYEPLASQYAEANLAEAQRILDDAGWVEGADGIRERDGERLSIELSTTSGNERRAQTSELIRAQLAPAGIDVVLDDCPSDCLFSERLPQGQFQVTLKSFTASPFPIADARARFETGGGDNYGGFSDEEFDRLAAEASQELDLDERRELGNAMAERVWEGLTMIPIYQLPNLVAYRDDITGIEPNGTREGMFWNSAGWSRSG